MGTRSLTTFIDNFDDEEIVVMYRQMDGYPEGHGKELVNFLMDIRIVNGIGLERPKKIANGISCLAAQTVSYFKQDDVGHIYLHKAGTRGTGEEYIYTIYVHRCIEKTNDMLKVRVHKVYDNKDIFDGTVQEMKDWIETT